MLRLATLLTALTLVVVSGCGDGSDDGEPQEERDAERSSDAENTSNKTRNKKRENADPDPYLGWTVYTHPQGATFKHPPGWTTQEGPMGVALVPEGVAPRDALNEVFIVVWGGPDIVNDPASQQTARLLSQALRGTLPGFTQTGGPRAFETEHGPAAAYTYSGAVPNSVWDTAVVRYTVKDGVGIGMTAVGASAKLDRYDKELEQVFASIGLPKAKPADQAVGKPDDQAGKPGSAGAKTDDPRLIGAFVGEAYAGGDGIHFNTQLTYVLNPDGTFLSGARSSFNASQRDINGNLEWTADGDTAGSVTRGTWSAKSGRLTIDWDKGGRSVFAYGFEPDGTLAMRDPNTRKLINIYTRVR